MRNTQRVDRYLQHMFCALQRTACSKTSACKFFSHNPISYFQGGIRSLTIHLAGEFAPFGVRVNSISPGWVLTNIEKNSFLMESQYDKGVLAKKPSPELILGKEVLEGEESWLKKPLLPEDVAEAIKGLMTMRGVTGQDLVVDGGCGGELFPYAYPEEWKRE